MHHENRHEMVPPILRRMASVRAKSKRQPAPPTSSMPIALDLADDAPDPAAAPSSAAMPTVEALVQAMGEGTRAARRGHPAARA